MMKGRIFMKKTWPIEIDCPNCAAKLEAALGSTECAQVKPAFFNPDVRCLNAVKAACRVLEAQMAARR